LSYAKVRAITRVANADNEQRLLEVALAGAQLEQICRGLRSATRGESEAAQERVVRARTLGNRLVKLEVVVTPDESTLIISAIERVRETLTPRTATNVAAPGPITEEPRPAAPRPSAVDALPHLVSSAVDDAASSDERVSGSAAEVVIHVDRELTSSDGALSACLADGTPVSAETLRRVCCDGGIVAAAVDDHGAVLDVGRRTRAIPAAIRRALWIRDQGCRFPGCMNQRYVHGHHIKHWLHGGAEPRPARCCRNTPRWRRIGQLSNGALAPTSGAVTPTSPASMNGRPCRRGTARGWTSIGSSVP
jgi:hypothetical protein